MCVCVCERDATDRRDNPRLFIPMAAIFSGVSGCAMGSEVVVAGRGSARMMGVGCTDVAGRSCLLSFVEKPVYCFVTNFGFLIENFHVFVVRCV